MILSSPTSRSAFLSAYPVTNKLLGVDGISDFGGLYSGKHNDEIQLYAFDILALAKVEPDLVCASKSGFLI
jgi:hypothetical protein